MKSVYETLHFILSHAPLMESEPVSLAEALHRVLREDGFADADSPPFDCSAMDGYALRSADSGAPLTVTGEIQPGDSRKTALNSGECVRIFTGAKMPVGADCVLMQEHAILEAGTLLAPRLVAFENMRCRGENSERGSLVVKAGGRLQPADLAVLASCGVVQPRVSRRPRVVHFATGNELVDPATMPVGSQIRDTNSILIATLLAAHGAALIRQERLADSFQSSALALQQVDDFDLLLISGGASVGDYDFTKALLQDAGFEILQAGVDLRPGKPLLFAARGQQLAFGIPGNPVSHWVIFQLLIAPLIAAMLGVSQPEHRLFQGCVRDGLKPNSRETWWPARAEWSEGAFQLSPLRLQSSGDIAGIAGANALIRIPPNSTIKENDLAEFLWLQSHS